jgi:hypothetical protein
MMVDIQGDAGLSYVLESGGLPLSAQTGWGPAYAVFVSPDSFPYRLGNGPGGEVGIGEIVRARTQPTSICNLNLKRAAFAKRQLAVDRNLIAGSPCTESDVKLYIPDGFACPAGGVYAYGVIATDPTCSVVGIPFEHSLEMTPLH